MRDGLMSPLRLHLALAWFCRLVGRFGTKYLLFGPEGNFVYLTESQVPHTLTSHESQALSTDSDSLAYLTSLVSLVSYPATFELVLAYFILP